LLLLLLFSRPVAAQNDIVSQARAAMDLGNYADAVRLLSTAIASQPSPDAYRYLGISYANIREWTRAEAALKEGERVIPPIRDFTTNWPVCIWRRMILLKPAKLEARPGRRPR
jgi:tetratricopeptide (TPR) repeat protein